ncbi:Imm7 family immunity protein [Kitasatospora sp. NPDC096204]|uniref:Imm7 family immunity protein n=1 Tax=Kitasatospora sp. NPDC096204 TaxID=3364094 RepID=UPI0037F616DA
MFEYHGWIKVLESAGADDEDDADRFRRVVEGIEERVQEIGSPYLLDLRWMNGEVFIHFGGFPNHRDAEILAFFREVGERAPGSYGLLHVRDDEDPGRENEVLVIRMVRGQVSEHPESLLSPGIPVLEDPFQGGLAVSDPADPTTPPRVSAGSRRSAPAPPGA